MFLRLIAALLLVAGLAAPVLADPVTVGGRPSAAQRLLVEMTAQLLEARGLEVARAEPMGTAALRAALRRGEVDLAWEYTGAALVLFHHARGSPSPEEAYERVREADLELDLVWLEPSPVMGGHALAMARPRADELGIRSIGDLARAIEDGNQLQLATAEEFFARQDGLRPLQTAYGFRFARDHVHLVPQERLFEVDVDVLAVLVTDGRIEAHDLVLLEDDLGFFPPYQLAPVARADALKAHPEIAEALAGLAAALDLPTLRRMARLIDVDGVAVEAVARALLSERGLLG